MFETSNEIYFTVLAIVVLSVLFFLAYQKPKTQYTILQTELSKSGDMKVDIFQRKDKTFGFHAQKWSNEEECWITFGRFSECRVGTAEEAL